MLAGATCRSIDAIYLANGKTALGVAMMAAAFVGVFALLVSALNTAFFSGGLPLAPILAGVLVKAIKFRNQTGPSSMPVGSS
jgi:hypothetical protein